MGRRWRRRRERWWYRTDTHLPSASPRASYCVTASCLPKFDGSGPPVAGLVATRLEVNNRWAYGEPGNVARGTSRRYGRPFSRGSGHECGVVVGTDADTERDAAVMLRSDLAKGGRARAHRPKPLPTLLAAVPRPRKVRTGRRLSAGRIRLMSFTSCNMMWSGILAAWSVPVVLAVPADGPANE